MYSYEERVRAVELFIKLGKRVRAVSGASVTRLTCSGWLRDFWPEQRAPSKHLSVVLTCCQNSANNKALPACCFEQIDLVSDLDHIAWIAETTGNGCRKSFADQKALEPCAYLHDPDIVEEDVDPRLVLVGLATAKQQ
jgi:hypothetical protein